MKINSLFIQTRLGLAFLVATAIPTAAAALQCDLCHTGIASQWSQSVHAQTQSDVADELSHDDVGLTPAGVVQQEDCIACHGPTAVLANNGMTEAQALGYFFTTTNGQFSTNTTVANTTAWPHVTCTACHNVPANHPASMPTFALFDSQTAQYQPVANATELCGQCHGNLHFADTDHLTYNAWSSSKHAHTQADVADELSHDDIGLTPAGVIQGEDCIACHAPTAVLANGGITEAQALDFFFTTTNGQFSPDTTVANSTAWPQVACTACHDPHNPGVPSYFNSATQQYEVMSSSAQLCGQCHGNLRFPDTDHLSYNILQGTGGVGVTNMQTMPGVTCTDCHMYNSGVDGSTSAMYHGHSWAITVSEPDGGSTTSCTHCHSTMDTAVATAQITSWKTEFQTLDATVEANVARATAAVAGTTNAALAEAEANLTYAESDESGGFHNHSYLMALLNDANAKALSIPILTAAWQGTNVVISWTGTGTLQSASAVSGPWQNVTNAPNPFVVAPGAQGTQQYYRLHP